MSRKKKANKDIEQYDHAGKKRLNNPPVGLVSENTEPYSTTKKTYEYDPHLDPELQWAGKAEHTSFEVPTVSLHVHERIDPKTIVENVQREETDQEQISLFESEKKPLREAIEFYKHKEGWSNRMIAGDSLLVMNSLLEKEGMAGNVQMIYIDPPYGIKYGSNFQPFVNKRDVKDRKDEDLTAEPEVIKAFRDTWELGIHSYLTYLQDRLLLARELLTESGSVFVQISDENVHRVRCLLDEVFGVGNFISLISFKKTVYQETSYLANVFDLLLWYGKSRDQTKVRKLFRIREEKEIRRSFDLIELSDGSIERATKNKDIPQDASLLRASDLTSKGASEKGSLPYTFVGMEYRPKAGNHWKTHSEGLDKLTKANRLIAFGKTLCFKKYARRLSENRLIGQFSRKKFEIILKDTRL